MDPRRLLQVREEVIQPVIDLVPRLGAVVAVPDYRLYPEVRYPVFVEDADRAPREERANSRTALAVQIVVNGTKG